MFGGTHIPAGEKFTSIGPLCRFPSVDFHRDAVESVHWTILKVNEPEDGKRVPSTPIKQVEGMKGIAWKELSARWNVVVDVLKRDGVTVINPDHALEGALTIRYCVPPVVDPVEPKLLLLPRLLYAVEYVLRRFRENKK